MNADAVADHTFALLLALQHNIVAHDGLMRKNAWAADPGFAKLVSGGVSGARFGARSGRDQL